MKHLIFLLLLSACSTPMQSQCTAPAERSIAGPCIWNVEAGLPCSETSQVLVDGTPVEASVVCGAGQVVLSSAACSAALAGGVVEFVVPCATVP